MADPVTIRFDSAALRTLLVSTDGDVAKDLQRRALRVDRQAKRLCPVDTGRLRSSITNQLARDATGLLALVGSNVHYAPYIELGTSRMRAQPFLRPALEAGR
jgi:HK97 gp10 family phage protein